jgi:hypothetical protein
VDVLGDQFGRTLRIPRFVDGHSFPRNVFIVERPAWKNSTLESIKVFRSVI